MIYNITFIVDSDYCLLQPSDTVCQRQILIEADNKTQAVMRFHKEKGDLIKGIGSHNNSLVIWSIDKVE